MTMSLTLLAEAVQMAAWEELEQKAGQISELADHLGFFLACLLVPDQKAAVGSHILVFELRTLMAPAAVLVACCKSLVMTDGGMMKTALLVVCFIISLY